MTRYEAAHLKFGTCLECLDGDWTGQIVSIEGRKCIRFDKTSHVLDLSSVLESPSEEDMTYSVNIAIVKTVEDAIDAEEDRLNEVNYKIGQLKKEAKKIENYIDELKNQ